MAGFMDLAEVERITVDPSFMAIALHRYATCSATCHAATEEVTVTATATCHAHRALCMYIQ